MREARRLYSGVSLKTEHEPQACLSYDTNDYTLGIEEKHNVAITKISKYKHLAASTAADKIHNFFRARIFNAISPCVVKINLRPESFYML